MRTVLTLDRLSLLAGAAAFSGLTKFEMENEHKGELILLFKSAGHRF